MATVSDTVLIGSFDEYDERICAAMVAQVHVGDVACIRLAALAPEPPLAAAWWPASPERILPDLMALVALHLLEEETSSPELLADIVRGDEVDLAEVDRLADLCNKDRRTLSFSFILSPASSITREEISTYCTNVGIEILERTYAKSWNHSPWCQEREEERAKPTIYGSFEPIE
jgi:hypothetical protein